MNAQTSQSTFPIYRRDTDTTYADNIPYNDTLALTRIEASGRVTTATRTREECGRNCTVGWEIESEIVEQAELASYVAADHRRALREYATAEEFEAHLAEARAWMGI